MVLSKLRLGAVLLGVFCLGVAAVPAWAGNVPVVDTTGFGASIGTTSSLGVASSNPCSMSCSTSIYTVDISSQAFFLSGTFTYVYTIKLDTASTFACNSVPVCTSTPNPDLTLSSITIGSPNFDLVGLNYGVVTGVSIGTGFSSATLNPSSLQFLPTGLGVGKTLQVYAQSKFGPFNTSGSTQDGGNVAGATVLAPTPEPTSIALFGSGLVVLGGVIRRRLRRKVS